MKRYNNPVIALIIVFAVFQLITAEKIQSQDGPADVSMEFTTWKFSDGSRDLIVKLTSGSEKGDLPATGVPVKYFTGENDAEIEIGVAESDKDGIARLKIDRSQKLSPNQEGYINFTARFDGNDLYNAAEAELQVIDALIELEFDEIDSVRTIVYRGVVKNPRGLEEPMADQDIYIYVPRMFSLLKIEDGWLEEDGEGEMVFPANLSGDSTGNIQIIARIEEHPDFGNLEASGFIGWGKHKHGERFEGPQRELWTPIAPLWMIITLIIMLSGVWGHYFYAAYQLYKIKQIGKKSSDTK